MSAGSLAAGISFISCGLLVRCLGLEWDNLVFGGVTAIVYGLATEALR